MALAVSSVRAVKVVRREVPGSCAAMVDSDEEDGHITVWHGKRKCHIYQCEGYWFHKESFNIGTGVTFFKCREYRDGCPARAKSNLHGPLERHLGFHNHPVNPAYAEYLGERRKLIELCLKQDRRTSKYHIIMDFKEQYVLPASVLPCFPRRYSAPSLSPSTLWAARGC